VEPNVADRDLMIGFGGMGIIIVVLIVVSLLA
jgi:hypothetical protein